MDITYLGSAALIGLILGGVCVVVWRTVLDRIGPTGFWSGLAASSREILAEKDPQKLLRTYGRMMRLTGAYSVGNIVGLALGLLPLIVVLVAWGPAVAGIWDAGAEYLEVFPPDSGTLLADVENAANDDRTLLRTEQLNDATFNLYESRYRLEPLWARHGFCGNAVTCATLDSLQFTVHPLAAGSVSSAYAVVRPSRPDGNPFWPFLGDLEFALFLAFFVGNIAGFLWLRRRT